MKNGTFSLPSMKAGTYVVVVNPGSNHDYVQGIVATGAKASGKELNIKGAGEVQLVITMGRGLGQVAGGVRLEGKVAAGVMVLLVPASGEDVEKEARMNQSDTDGVRAGEYHSWTIRADGH